MFHPTIDVITFFFFSLSLSLSLSPSLSLLFSCCCTKAMGDSKNENLELFKILLFTLMGGLGALAALTGFILMLVFLPSYDCQDESILKPGGQSSCNISKGWYESGSVEVGIENKSTAGAKLQTYVFNKEPTRVFENETFKWDLEEQSGKTRTFYLKLVSSAKYYITIKANEKVTVRYRYKGNKYYHDVFVAEDVQTYSGNYTADWSSDNARFVVEGTKSMKGKLEVVVGWPRWSWGPRDFALMCESYPCEFDMDDPKLADQDLWFVTINNGVDTFEVYTEGSEKFVPFFMFESNHLPLFHCVVLFLK